VNREKISFRSGIEHYRDTLFRLGRRSSTGEVSCYRALAEFLETVGKALTGGPVEVILLPRTGQGLCPDLQVLGPGGRPIGYVEAKRMGTDLDFVGERAQLRQYRQVFPNLLLTDFCTFLAFRDGVKAGRAAVLRPKVAFSLDTTPVDEVDRFLVLLESFFAFSGPRGWTAPRLARALARRTRQLKGMLLHLLAGQGHEAETLRGFHQAFSEHLIADLTESAFTDLYAQTLAFGLFAARIRLGSAGFTLADAFNGVPESLGVLRDAFRFLSLSDPPREVRWILRDMVELLARADVEKLFGTRRGNPIPELYETFLAEYDPGLRRRRGVFYTPRELVAYTVRVMDQLFATDLGWERGLADPRVTLLDPAMGTGTFLVEACRRVFEGESRRGGEGFAAERVRRLVLERFFGFELMMAPYVVGHLNLSLTLEELGLFLEPQEHLQLFLTDALDETELEQSALPGMSSLSAESRGARRVKVEVAIPAILGNPPWQGHSANTRSERLAEHRRGHRRSDGSWDDGYFASGGAPLGEANPKWLNDDYVQFLRMAQRKVDQVGEGMLALVLNHGFLENPTFRGLRESLLGSFDRLYLLDLHGNRKKKEKDPDGGSDENLFGIRQGVAVAFLVKQKGLPRGVFRADLYGTRRFKRSWLAAHDRFTTPWKRVGASAPHFLFARVDPQAETAYERFFPLEEIFPVHSVGVITGRDAFALDLDPQRLLARVGWLRGDLSEPEAREVVGPAHACPEELATLRRKLKEDEPWRQRVREILHRPFDVRFIFYADYLVKRPRRSVMRHLLAGPNVGLVVPRQGQDGPDALVTDRLIGHKVVSAYDINSLFPLYLYREAPLLAPPSPGPRPGPDRPVVRTPNLHRDFTARLRQAWGEPLPAPEEILGYVYGVLASPLYRSLYAGPLRRGFPRIPWPRDPTLFRRLAELGQRLVELHLLRGPEEGPESRGEGEGEGRARFPVPGHNRIADDVRKIRYQEEARRVVINGDGQYFEGIRPAVWSFRIGGYAVLPNWLRARAGRHLRAEEMATFCRIAAALEETLALRGEVDALYTLIEAGPLLLRA